MIRKMMVLWIILAGIACSSMVLAETLTVGYLTGGASPFGAVAESQGLFIKEGLTVKLVPFSSSPDALNALNSGKLDIAAGFGTAPPLIFIGKGADFVVIAGHMTGGHAIVGTPEFARKYKNIRSFIGKTVVSPRLITPDVILKGALNHAGITYGTDGNVQVRIVETKNGPQALQVLKSGKVDAAALVHTEVELARQAGYKVLAWSIDIFPEHPCCRVVVKRDFLKNHSETLTAFLRAWIQAERVREYDRKAYVEAYARQGNFSNKKADEILYEPHVSHSADPNTLAVIKMWDYLRNIDYIQSTADIRKNINTSLYKTALDQLAKQNPQDKFYKKLEARFRKFNPPGKALAQAVPGQGEYVLPNAAPLPVMAAVGDERHCH